MKVNIIDKKSNNWFLAKVSLWDYLSSLSLDDFDYSVQRGIVKNPFLDTILDSVYNDNPMPPISLVVNTIDARREETILDKFDILDGLQRTYRLWIYKSIADVALKEKSNDYRVVTSIVREDVHEYSKAVTPRQVRMLFEQHDDHINVWNLKDKFSNFDVYLYIWAGLNDSEVVKKMLILNAGQKRMAVSHQYELMYLRLFKDFKYEHPEVVLYRSKDAKFLDVSKGIRNKGEFNIPTIIIGMESFIKGDPVRLSADLLLDKMTSDLADEDGFISESSVNIFFNKDFMSSMIQILEFLDNKIANSADYVKWFVKDTTISGIMAGLGKFIREEYSNDEEFAGICREKALNLITKLPKSDPFDLTNFEREYNQLSSVRINIGNVVRKAICDFTYTLISRGGCTWKQAFSNTKK